jgi:hypothetical protein
MTHNILVNAYCIAPDRIVAGTAGSYGLERMALTFSEEWKDVAKTVTFYPPKSRPVSVVLADGDEFDIPHEATAKSGEISFTVLGYRDGKRIFSVTGEMLVLATKNKEGVPSEEPTPSEKEQVLAYVQDVKEMIDAGKIKGEDGYTPIKGVDYFDGKDGYTPIKGVDYFDGRDGYTPVKGVDYFDGKDGRDGQDGKDGINGKDGTSVAIDSITESDEDGGENVVTFSDGKTLTVKNGNKGGDGEGGGNSVYFSEEEPTDAKTGDFWYDESEGDVSGGVIGGGGGISKASKTLLIAILRNGVYTSNQKANIDALEAELNKTSGDDDTGGDNTGGESGGDDTGGGETEVTLTSISATYSGGDVKVGTELIYLSGIVVTATYSDGSTATVTGYTLTGTIAEGSNTITVVYEGKTTTFTVMGVPANDFVWVMGTTESTGLWRTSAMRLTPLKKDGTFVALTVTDSNASAVADDFRGNLHLSTIPEGAILLTVPQITSYNIAPALFDITGKRIYDAGYGVTSIDLTQYPNAVYYGANVKTPSQTYVTADEWATIAAAIPDFIFTIDNTDEDSGDDTQTPVWIAGHSGTATSDSEAVYGPNGARAALLCTSGDIKLRRYTNSNWTTLGDGIFYPVLIPNGCTKVTVSCEGYTWGIAYLQVQNGKWVRIADPGWQTLNGSTHTITESNAEAVFINLKVGTAGTTSITNVPNTVTVTFS